MSVPQSFVGAAWNPVPDSENRIHSDEVARAFGFEGALVPGVTVSAYLAEPAVVAWGLDWLTRGKAHIVVKKPVYDGRAFRVEVRLEGPTAFTAELTVDGTLSATGLFELPTDVPAPPRRRGDAPVGYGAPPTREGLEGLRARGMGAVRIPWTAGLPMASYYLDPGRMPALLRMDGGGLANTSFVLGVTNWVFAANVALGPWVHLETHSQHHAPVPRDTELVVEAAVVDLFEKKGHEFVDVDVAAYLPDDTAALTARLRAIYRLRGA